MEKDRILGSLILMEKYKFVDGRLLYEILKDAETINNLIEAENNNARNKINKTSKIAKSRKDKAT